MPCGRACCCTARRKPFAAHAALSTSAFRVNSSRADRLDAERPFWIDSAGFCTSIWVGHGGGQCTGSSFHCSRYLFLSDHFLGCWGICCSFAECHLDVKLNAHLLPRIVRSRGGRHLWGAQMQEPVFMLDHGPTGTRTMYHEKPFHMVCSPHCVSKVSVTIAWLVLRWTHGTCSTFPPLSCWWFLHGN